ncbi:MAG: hypothetical protein JWM11_280 [Planctomycetaceae bacterium]|nr:hypothetical protein [Planctomycetaceae bacterium]
MPSLQSNHNDCKLSRVALTGSRSAIRLLELSLLFLALAIPTLQAQPGGGGGRGGAAEAVLVGAVLEAEGSAGVDLEVGSVTPSRLCSAIRP